jgi:OOP family OmpA-OmpF porin
LVKVSIIFYFFGIRRGAQALTNKNREAFMDRRRFFYSCAILIAVTSIGIVSGCANYEINTYRGNIPGHFIRYEMQEADRAVEAARKADKDKLCPTEFKAAEDAKNNAYDVFRACHTEEGAALAKQATEKANALCPPQKVEVPPPPAVPGAYLEIVPGSITKGESAKMSWKSHNADECDIKPDVGKVKPQDSMMISPPYDAAYTIVCSGAGGKADSTAKITVLVPQPQKLCTPTVINIQFDTDKSDIKPKYYDELKKFADFLKEYPKVSGTIEGHTDSVGSKNYNFKLSQRRAGSVRNYLIKNLGIAPERLDSKGFGLTRPIADNKTSDGRQKNRRIESNFKCDGN